MSPDTLGSTGFEGTLLDAQEANQDHSIKSNSATSYDPFAVNFKGTALGQQSDFEKELGLEKTEPVIEQKKSTPLQSRPAAKTDTKKKNDLDNFYDSIKNYSEGDTVSGIITKIKSGSVYVDINYKAEGIIEPDELSNRPEKAENELQVGQRISVKILRLENKAGNPVLSKKRADFEIAWQNIQKASRNNQEIEVVVKEALDGGLVAEYDKTIRAFIPFTQLPQGSDENMDEYLGKTVYARVLKVDRQKRKAILSLKNTRHVNIDKKLKEILEKIKPGDVLKGKVTSIKSYGAFVNLGEVDGLIHISEMSWSRISKVEDLLALDQEVEVLVLKVNPETGKISLSIKQLTPDPWNEVMNKYKVGDKVKATISRLLQFGAFATIEKDIEGLIHITELADHQVKYPEEVVKPGQEVEATIIRMDNKEHKLALSLRSNPELGKAAETPTETSPE